MFTRTPARSNRNPMKDDLDPRYGVRWVGFILEKVHIFTRSKLPWLELPKALCTMV
jgi:hypothetical protein